MSDPLGVDLETHVQRARLARLVQPEGRVAEVVGMLVEVDGISAAVGSQLEACGLRDVVPLEVLGFRNGRVLAAPLGRTAGLAPGARVRASPAAAMAAVGPALLGRIIDAFGRALDGKPE